MSLVCRGCFSTKDIAEQRLFWKILTLTIGFINIFYKRSPYSNQEKNKFIDSMRCKSTKPSQSMPHLSGTF